MQILRFTFVFICLFTFFTKAGAQSLEKQYVSTPKDVTSYLQNLPEKSLTLRLILGRSIATSDSFRAIQSGLIEKKAPQLEASSSLATVVEITGSYIDNQNEPSSAFSASSIITSGLEVSASKKFASGTSVSAEVSHGSSATDFVSFSDSKVVQSELSLSVSQSLWRDSFGRSTQKKLLAGENLSKSIEAGVNENSLVWMGGLTNLFYQSWLGQAQVKAAKENADRKKRLLQITKLQARRGTSERPDVIQVSEALLASEIQWRDTVDALEDIWRDLVISLKMPLHWTRVDPMEIPLKLDDPVSSALAKCSKHLEGGTAEQWSDRILRLQMQKEAYKAQAEAAKDELNPNLSFSLGLVANGIDETNRGSTLSEAFSAKFPAWTVGVSLQMPIERYQQRANLLRAATRYSRVQAEEAQARSDFEIDWVNVCNQLRSWEIKLARLKKSLEAQKTRSELEEKRFRLGRGILNNVILAGDDRTATETRLNVAEVEIRKTAWDVLRRTGDGKAYLAELKNELMAKVKK